MYLKIRKGLKAVFFTSFIVTIIFSIPFSAHAQTPTDIQNAQRQSERIQREQSQRQQEDINRAAPESPHTTLSAPTPVPQQGHGTGCLMIHRIEIAGHIYMKYPEGGKIVEPYLAGCLGVNEIQAMLSALTKFYVDKGFVTTRAYLPSQDLSTGVLHILIVPGTLDHLRTDSSKTGITHLGNIFPGVAGSVLNLRDFEQGIDQLNRLSSNNASIDLEAGAQPGETVVVIKNEPDKRWHGNLTTDNYGTRTTGRDQLGTTLSYDNLSGFNDFVSITERKTFPLGDNDKQASSTSGQYSIPFGYATFTAGWTSSDYDSILHTAGGNNLHLSGDGRSIFTTLDDVLYRDQNGKLSAHVTLTNGKTDSFIQSEKLGVSSRTLTVGNIGTSYQRTIGGGSANLSFDYFRGLNILNALDDPSGLPGNAPRAQFDKFTVNAGYSKPFKIHNENLCFSTQFSGQYAPDTLYGSEQFSVGGMYTVRGFYEEELANDDGFYLRNDLTLNKSLGTIYHWPATLRPFVAFDVGSVGSRTSGVRGGTLGGAAAGFSLQSGPIDFNIYSGYPLFYPDSVHNERFNTFARLSVNF